MGLPVDEIPGSRGDLTDPELEQVLTRLGRHVAYPPIPDIASRVRATLESSDAISNSRARFFQRIPRPGRASPWDVRLALLAACLLAALAASVVLLPDVRTAIANRLGLRGAEIRWLDETPPPPPSPVGRSLMLGRPVMLAEAQAAVRFPVLIPAAAGIGVPQEIYVSGGGADAMISFVYPAATGLPAVGETGAGALLTQFAGRTERSLIEKGLVSPSTSGQPESLLEPVTVHGEPGFWISGAPHAVFFVCSGVGECRQEPYRLAGDVLLWEHEGVTLRLESGLSRDAALAIAETVRAARRPDSGTTPAGARYIE